MSERGGVSGGAKAWFGSELGARIVSGIALAAVALLATYRGGWAFAVFLLAAGTVMALEWVDMTRTQPSRWVKVQLTLCLACLTMVYLLPGLDPRSRALILIALLGAGALAVLSSAQSRRDRAWGVGALVYAAVVVLVPPLVRDHPELGITGLLWMFAVVWTTDVVAYFTGRSLGGPKLWTRVSPKKTWSGFGGGLVAGTGAGVLVFVVAVDRGWTPVAPLGLVLLVSAVGSVVSQLGDLGESALKRRFGVKDSGQLIPGHGGVMDRLDGFWAVALLLGGIMAGASAVRD